MFLLSPMERIAPPVPSKTAVFTTRRSRTQL